jgi:hypothetical protein
MIVLHLRTESFSVFPSAAPCVLVEGCRCRGRRYACVVRDERVCVQLAESSMSAAIGHHSKYCNHHSMLDLSDVNII